MEVLVSRWAFGPKVLKNIRTLVTLTTVAMAKKTYLDLIKRPKGCGILSGGTLDGYGCVANRYYEPLLPWKPLSVAMVTKKCQKELCELAVLQLN